MYNKYTIEISQENEHAKATIYLNKDSLGSIWNPSNYLKSKVDFEKLFISIGDVIYGKEEKARREAESFDKILTVIEADNNSRQAQ